MSRMLSLEELKSRNKTNAVRSTKTNTERALIIAVEDLAEENKCDPQAVLNAIAARVEENYSSKSPAKRLPEKKEGTPAGIPEEGTAEDKPASKPKGKDKKK